MATTKNNPKAQGAYSDELQRMQINLETLKTALETARGDGNFSDKLHWGHVGDLKYINSLLEQALEFKLEHVKNLKRDRIRE